MKQNNVPRIFISHAWEDKALVRRIEAELRAAGAQVWVDHSELRAGENLPKRISNTLAWCNCLLLVWLKAATLSRWVELEWTNALSLEKRIIPCIPDGSKPPEILTNTLYVDFYDPAKGIAELLRSLHLSPGKRVTEVKRPLPRKPEKPADPVPAKTKIKKPADVKHTKVRQQKGVILIATLALAVLGITAGIAYYDELIKLKIPMAKILNQSMQQQPDDSTQSAGVESPFTPNPRTLTNDQVKQMLAKWDFFDSDWNSSGKGFDNDFKMIERRGEKLVIDRKSGLTWQQFGSKNRMTYADAEKHILDMRTRKVAGYDDWRLPTMEEAMSLMEREKSNDALYINSIFDKRQRWIWTADKSSASSAWVVTFGDGGCLEAPVDSNDYVRAVR